MAIPVASMKAFSRAQKRSATASAAYRAGAEIVDERTGEVHDYTRKRDVLHTELIVPTGMRPPADRSALWNDVEAAETRKNSTVAREWVLAMPHELPPEARLELAQQFVREFTEEHVVAGELCIHAPHRDGDERNHHAHFLFSTRRWEPDGTLGAKTRELDDRKSGPTLVTKWRERWGQLANEMLERHGLSERITMESYAAQGLELLPEPKLGPAAAAMERRGIQTRVGDLRREVLAHNQAVHAQMQLLAEMEREAEIERNALAVLERQELATKTADLEDQAADFGSSIEAVEVENPPSPRLAEPPWAPEALAEPEAVPSPAPPASVEHATWRIEQAQSELQQIEQRRRQALELLQAGATPRELLERRPEVLQALAAAQAAEARLEAARPSLLARLRHRLGGPDPLAGERQALADARESLRAARVQLLPDARREAEQIRRDALPLPGKRANELQRELRELERQREQLERERQQERHSVKPKLAAKATNSAPRMNPRRL